MFPINGKIWKILAGSKNNINRRKICTWEVINAFMINYACYNG
jgi:hypothetical protein